MTTMIEIAPAVKTTTLTIKGLEYSALPIDAGEQGTAAYRLEKRRGDKARYDVVRTHDGLVACDCPSYTFTHEGTASTCKHGQALVEAGLLAAPCPVPNKPTVEARPITAKDIAAARTWGLKLPNVAPVLLDVLPTPAPVVVEAKVAEASPAPEIVEANPRDSWPEWTGEDRWAITEEAAPIAESTPIEAGPAEVDDRISVVDAEGRTIEAALDADGSLVVTWTAPKSVEPTEAVSTFRATHLPAFTPTVEQEAERLGYELGSSGELANAPAGWDFPRLVAFYQGWLDGKDALEAEALADLAWIEERERDAFGDPMDRYHPAELTEAGFRSGHPANEG